ncbi:MAG TPA: hypothetical protein VGF99_18910 [Myxococcota bacterium]
MTTVAPAVAPPAEPVVADVVVDPDAATLCGIFPTSSGLHCSVVPAFENGRAIGFKMFGVHRRAAAQARGLEDGDIVMRFNGFDLDTSENGLKAFASVTSCDEARIVVKRKGVVVELGPSAHAE